MKFVKLSIGIALLATLTGCGPQTADISGTMSIPTAAVNLDDSPPYEPGDICFFGDSSPDSPVPSASDYPDIGVGTQVKLLGPDGSIVAISSLGRGGLRYGWRDFTESYFTSSDTFKEDLCDYEFTFEEVTLEEDFYSVEVANRGQLTYSVEELLDGVALSLGG